MLGEAGGLANDETGVDFADGLDGSVYGFEAGQEILDGLVGKVFAGHAYGRQGRDGVLGELNIVEADE